MIDLDRLEAAMKGKLVAPAALARAIGPLIAEARESRQALAAIAHLHEKSGRPIEAWEIEAELAVAAAGRLGRKAS
jgi:hypothetical protein